MSSDIHQAFAHPEARAAATAGEGPFDRISLRDHTVEVEIGAFQAERGHRQRVCFNVVVEVTPDVGPVDDDVDRILSYDRITEAIQIELKAERLNLLETLAERVAERILTEPRAFRVFVRIEKLDRGPGALGVEIVRTHGQVGHAAQQMETPVPHPRVVYFSNAAIASGRIGGWLDRLEGSDLPVLICVGMGEVPAPQSAARLAQRRIDLLAIEQNAWVLAGQDNRCMVVGTRTELDWAMKNGQISVWAPSKIVLDSVEHPASSPRDGAALAAWFAGQMKAAELVVVDAAAPEADVPVRVVAMDGDIL